MLRDFVALEVDDIAIVGQLFLPDQKAWYPAVCVCHGIPSGNPPDPGDGGYPLLAEKLCYQGWTVLIFNFRGTGDSGGNLDILGWTRDLQAAIDYLWNLGVDRSQLYLVGFSAGAATSVYVASRDKRVSGVAACACPADFSLILEGNGGESYLDQLRRIGAIRDDDFPPSVEAWRDNFRAVTPIDQVAGITPRPLLLLHGSDDELVPVSQARRLYEKAGEPKQLVVLDGAGHRLRQDERAVSVVLEWLRAQYQNTGS